MRNFTLGTFLLLVLFVSGSRAQQPSSLNFIGYVRDEVSKDGIGGVTVTVVGDQGKAPATTDATGLFVLHLSPDVKVGSTVRILLQKQGYNTWDEFVPVPAELSRTFLLRRAKTANGNKSAGSQANT